MAERPCEIPIEGHSVKGKPRKLGITPGQPGLVALTIYISGKPVTVVVPLEELRNDLAGLSAQRNVFLPNRIS